MSAETRNQHQRFGSGFTLIELLVVISIIAILAAISLPVAKQFKPDPVATATHQLLDDINFARRKAIADHTTVYVIFMPSVANLDPTILTTLAPIDQQKLAKGQYTAYALYEKRQIGDQPGQHTEHYVTDWRYLPAGTMFAPQKFGTGIGPVQTALPLPFNYKTFFYNTANFNFFSDPANTNALSSFSRFPYIAFDYKGSLASPWEQWRPPAPPLHDTMSSGGFDAVIPLTQGRINIPRQAANPTLYAWLPPTYVEDPAGGWTNRYTHIVIDGPTGRARVDRQKVQ